MHFRLVRLLAVLVALIALIPREASAQSAVDLTHYVGASTSHSDFSYCGPSTKSFRVAYDYYWGCPVGLGGCGPYGTCGANPYRMTATLYRDGTPLGTQTLQASASWSVFTFSGISLAPGTYKATVKLEKRNWTCIGWQTVHTISSNLIVGSATPATPSFTINSIVPPKDGSPIDVCASLITVDAAATTCESTYFLTVQESDQWWNRTYQYEWGRWFAGQAPNGLNLQLLSTTWSYPPYFTGPVTRQGNSLFSGNLPVGGERFYRVSLCTGEPSWTCASALINVDGNCKVLDAPPPQTDQDAADGSCNSSAPDGTACGDDAICIAGVCEASGLVDEDDVDNSAEAGAGCAIDAGKGRDLPQSLFPLAGLFGLAVLRRRSRFGEARNARRTS